MPAQFLLEAINWHDMASISINQLNNQQGFSQDNTQINGNFFIYFQEKFSINLHGGKGRGARPDLIIIIGSKNLIY